MALPTKIPSTFRRTPIVKIQNPALYSTSATQINSENSFVISSSFGILNNYVLRYRSATSSSARMLGLNSNVDLSVIEEEYKRLLSKTGRTPREEQILGNLSMNSKEIIAYRSLILDSVRELARKDSVDIRNRISQLNINSSFKTELIQIIDDVSLSTSGI